MYNRRIWSVLILTVAAVLATAAQAQHFAIKTNLLYDALTTPNLGVEVGVSRKMTAQVFYGINPWEYKHNNNDIKVAKHWVVMPEVRWWTCSKMNGWFIGVHGMTGQFNAADIKVPMPGVFFKGLNVGKTVQNTRVEGKYAGAGVTAGYQWILSRHWNLEAELGVGYDRVWYDHYVCPTCSVTKETGNSNYAGLTKAGICLMYVF